MQVGDAFSMLWGMVATLFSIRFPVFQYNISLGSIFWIGILAILLGNFLGRDEKK